MNDFVKYLNGLHNYYAQNQNAYGERNISSPYYSKTMVPIEVCSFILSSINENPPHVIILTGHAGDGKTSIMFQALGALGVGAPFLDPVREVVTSNGKKICCIKDFSEFSDTQKEDLLSEVIQFPAQGKYVFMVANTGPLINTFGRLFDSAGKSEEARMRLIEAMDSNSGEIADLYGYRILVINIAAIENTGFAKQYLNNILTHDLWAACQVCPKRHFCHIVRNHDLIEKNRDRVEEFIENFYIYQTEYGTRLTIRSITEHLAYMITGGDDCEDIAPEMAHEKLFSNLFFGFEGVISNPLADSVLAVKLAKESGVFLRRLRADEELLIRRNYQQLFGPEINQVINETDGQTKLCKEFDDELRRMYLFMSIVPDDQHRKDIEDMFSKQFLPYLSVRNGSAKPLRTQKDLVIDALRMIYLGTAISNSNMIPITMGAESGITQNVQLIAGGINTGDIELSTVEDSVLNKGRKNLILRIKKKEVCILNLPIIDHFEELKNGVISTNMDPQLSHGIENLKSQLLELADIDDERLDFLVMDNKGFTPMSITIENGTIALR